MTILYIGSGILLLYLIFSLFLTYLVQQIPRHSVHDPPDWSSPLDSKIPAADGEILEVWRIEPEEPSCGTVVFAHGRGRNRDRMVARARYFDYWGFTTVIHSARDHGQSSPCKFMNAIRFCEDIEALLTWVDVPVILHRHSAGASHSNSSKTPGYQPAVKSFLDRHMQTEIGK